MEELMNRKLTADGRGQGDEKKFRSILVLLQQFCQKPSASLYDQIASLVDHLDTAMFRMHANNLAINRGQEAMEERLEEIREQKEAVYRNEVIALQRLNQAKKLRAHNAECISLVKRIKKLPARKKTQKQLDVVNAELDQLYVKQKKLEGKLKTRRDYLSVMKNVFSRFDQFNEDVKPTTSKKSKAQTTHESKEEKRERRHKNRDSEDHRERHRYEDRRDRRSHKSHSSKRKNADRYYERDSYYEYRYHK